MAEIGGGNDQQQKKDDSSKADDDIGEPGAKLSIASIVMTKSILKRRKTTDATTAAAHAAAILANASSSSTPPPPVPMINHPSGDHQQHCHNCDTRVMFTFNVGGNHPTATTSATTDVDSAPAQTKEEDDPMQQQQTKNDGIEFLQWHPLKPWILVATDRGDVTIWNYSTNSVIHSFDTRKLFVSMLPNSKIKSMLSRSSQDPDNPNPEKRRKRPSIAKLFGSLVGRSSSTSDSQQSTTSDFDEELMESAMEDKGRDYPVGKVFSCGFFDPDVLHYSSFIPMSMVDGSRPFLNHIYLVCQRAIVLYDYSASQITDVIPSNMFLSHPQLESLSSSVAFAEFPTSSAPISCSHLVAGTSHGAILLCNVFEKRTSLVLGDGKRHHSSKSAITSIAMIHGHLNPFRCRFASACTEGKVLIWQLDTSEKGLASSSDARVLLSVVNGFEKLFPSPSSAAVKNLNYDPILCRLTATYDDRSISVWDLTNKDKITFLLDSATNARRRKMPELTLDLPDSNLKASPSDSNSENPTKPKALSAAPLCVRIKKFVITPIEVESAADDTLSSTKSRPAGRLAGGRARSSFPSTLSLPQMVAENLQQVLNTSDHHVTGTGGLCCFPKDTMIACVGPYSNRLVAVIPSKLATKNNSQLAAGIGTIIKRRGDDFNSEYVGSPSVVQLAVVFDLFRELQRRFKKQSKKNVPGFSQIGKMSRITRFVQHPLHPHMIVVGTEQGQVVCISVNQSVRPPIGDSLFLFPSQITPDNSRAMVSVDDENRLSLTFFKGLGKSNVAPLRKVDISYISPWPSGSLSLSPFAPGSDFKRSSSTIPPGMVWPGTPSIHCFDDDHFRRVRLVAIVWPNVHRFIVLRVFVYESSTEPSISLVDEGTGVSVAWAPAFTRAVTENRSNLQSSAANANENGNEESNGNADGGVLVKVATLVIAAQSSNATPKYSTQPTPTPAPPSKSGRSSSPSRGPRNGSPDSKSSQKERPPLLIYRHYYLYDADLPVSPTTDDQQDDQQPNQTPKSISSYEKYDKCRMRVSRLEMVPLGCEPVRLVGGGPLLLVGFGVAWTSSKPDAGERVKLDDEVLPAGSSVPATARALDCMNRSQFFHWTPIPYSSTSSIGDPSSSTANSVSIVDPSTGHAVSVQKKSKTSTHKLINVGTPIGNPSCVAWGKNFIDDRTTSYHLALSFSNSLKNQFHPQSVHVFCTTGSDLQLRHQSSLPCGVCAPRRTHDLRFFNGTLFIASDSHIQCAFVGFKPESTKSFPTTVSTSTTPMMRQRVGSLVGSATAGNKDDIDRSDSMGATAEVAQVLTSVPALSGLRVPENVGLLTLSTTRYPSDVSQFVGDERESNPFLHSLSSSSRSQDAKGASYSSTRGLAKAGSRPANARSYYSTICKFHPIPDYETHDNMAIQATADGSDGNQEEGILDGQPSMQSLWPQTLSLHPRGSTTILGIVGGVLMVSSVREQGIILPHPIGFSHPYCRFASLVSAGFIKQAMMWANVQPLKRHPSEISAFLESRGYINDACAVPRLNLVLVLDLYLKHIRIDEAIKFAQTISPRKLLKAESDLKFSAPVYDTISLSSVCDVVYSSDNLPANVIDSLQWKSLIRKHVDSSSLNAVKRLGLLLACGFSMASAKPGDDGDANGDEPSSRHNSPVAKPRQRSPLVSLTNPSPSAPSLSRQNSKRSAIQNALVQLTTNCFKYQLFDEAKFCALLINEPNLSRDFAKKAIKGQILSLEKDEELFDVDVDDSNTKRPNTKYRVIKCALEKELEVLTA